MGQCADGTSPTACALGGALCGSCAGDLAGRACIPSPMNASCGCKSQADCPTGMACDPKTSKCAKECDANRPCNGGCCSAAQNGQCVAGTGNGACGANGGVCADCAKVVQGGKLCFPTAGGGFCGCNTLGDCVGGAIACDGQTHACDFSCNVNQPCKTGCCSAGKCASGQSASACGRTGMCVDCGMSLLGRACLVTQSCGCDRAEDCPAGQACDLGTHTCTTKCNANQPCNGGCCVNSACVAGKDGKACGSTGGACIDCSNSQLGHACVGGSVCGCAVTADCPIAQACDPQKKLCVDTCIANQPCNGGCCLNGKCTAGISNSACGAIGKDCAPCSGTKPTCENGVCTAKCGGVGDGICDQGTCCSNGACVPGTTGAACGYSGTCVSCKGSSLGQKCIALMNAKDWTCGCDSQTDCLASNPKGGIPGQTCDMSFHTCTSLCGAMGVTICNGGCCSGPNGQCRPGNRDSACGVTGSFCASCSDGCQPGPRCDEDKGTCGCFRAFSVQGDVTCNGVFACFGNTNKFGCSLGTNRCCVPGVYNFKDLGNPGNCCTGQSVGGLCTCNLAGESAGTPSNPWFCCSLALDMMGNCACLKNGSRANFGGGVEKRACCSLKTTGDNCVAAGKGEACQTSDGCAAPLTCQAGKCA
jgi:hypothetical protein